MIARIICRTMSVAVGALFLGGVTAGAALAQEQEYGEQQDTLQQQQYEQVEIDAPEGYEKASQMTGLPELVPGLGVLYVKQDNLPVGPFLAYNQDGKLMSTVLMIPTETGMGETMPGQEQRHEQEWREGQEQQAQEKEGQEYEKEGQQPHTQEHQKLDPTQVGQIELEEDNVDHVEIRYNRGFTMARSGLDQPHYQVILWHVSADEAREMGQLGLVQRQEEEARGEEEWREDEWRGEETAEEEARREEEKQRQEEEKQRQEEEYGAEREVEGEIQPETQTHENIDAPSGYEPASQVAQMPEFAPGLGILFVKAENVPMGPYLAYDQDGNQVSTILMVPSEEFAQPQQQMEELQLEEKKVDHVEIRQGEGFTASTSPLNQRHYQVILWHVSPEEAQSLTQSEQQENR